MSESELGGFIQVGPQRLKDDAMDAVLAAADAGCFASYIEKQGGVLVPRKDYLIRTAYVRAYWLDLNYGKKKKVSVKRRKPLKPKKEKSSSREGDYMEGAEGNVFVLRKTYQNEQAARRAAAAKWQQLQRGAASFSITLARGRAELYPEMHGTVTGFKSEIDNQDWIIAKAEHTIDNSGFTTQLELEAKIPEWIAETE